MVLLKCKGSRKGSNPLGWAVMLFGVRGLKLVSLIVDDCIAPLK